MLMDCEYFESLISQGLDEELTNRALGELDSHLKECERCRAFVARVERDRALLRSLPAVDFVQESRSFWRRRWSIPVPVAASFLAISAAGWILALVSDRTVDIPVRQSKPMSYCIETIRVTSSQAISIESDSTSFNSLKEGI